MLDLDWLTISLYLVLVAIGWVSIYAAEYNGTKDILMNMSYNHGKQVIWISLSIVIGITILIIDSKFYTTFAYIIYFIVILSLIAVLIFGSTIKGSKSWFEIAGFSIQPAEFAKFATNLAIAKYLSTLNISLKSSRSKLIAFGIIAIPSILILGQGDFGTMLVFSAFILVLFREGLNEWFLIIGVVIIVLSILALLFNKFYLVGVLLLLLAISGYFLRKNKQLIYVLAAFFLFSASYIFTVDFMFNNMLEERHRDRINVLIGKSGNDWNVNQSKIAIGSGGFKGKGFLNGTQTKFDFVPELSTDFIFCTIGEDHGFLGSALVLLLFFGLLARIVFVAERQRSKFTRIYGYGVASILFFHVSINVGMTIGLAPVIGIPFPFFSYGGSSILAFTILLFVLLKLDGDRLLVLR